MDDSSVATDLETIKASNVKDAALTTRIQSFLEEHELLPAWQSNGYEQFGLIMIETYLSNQDAYQNIMQALSRALGEEHARALIQLVADFRRDDTARADDGSINHRVDAHDDDGGGSSISSLTISPRMPPRVIPRPSNASGNAGTVVDFLPNEAQSANETTDHVNVQLPQPQEGSVSSHQTSALNGENITLADGSDNTNNLNYSNTTGSHTSNPQNP